MRRLDFPPDPHGPARALFSPGVIHEAGEFRHLRAGCGEQAEKFGALGA